MKIGLFLGDAISADSVIFSKGAWLVKRKWRTFVLESVGVRCAERLLGWIFWERSRSRMALRIRGNRNGIEN